MAEILEVLAAVVIGLTAVSFEGIDHEAIAVIVFEVENEFFFVKTWESFIKDGIVHLSKVDFSNEISVGIVSSFHDYSVVEIVEHVVSLVDVLSRFALCF